MSSHVLSDALHARARELMARYPQKRSALILVLHSAQDEVGHITDDVVREVAEIFQLSSADVAGVVTFYTMFKRASPGRYLISLCTQSACEFAAAEDTVAKLREMVGPEHEAAADGAISWEIVECLAYCSAAPAAQVNYRDVPKLTPERAERLCSALRGGRELDDVIEEMRSDATMPEATSA
ncbi:MAG: NAD(P)H-dependent oxidoreductase subunit E [Actinomycetota bacterium]